MMTIQDVAKEAKVSVATVSRVLNKHVSVAPKTRAKVEEAIKHLNYEPNMLGRNLRRSASSMLLVLVPSISNPFYSTIVQGIEDVARRNNYNILLCNTDSEVERDKIYLDLLKQRLSDGAISMDPAFNLSMLHRYGLDYPVVECCEYSQHEDIPFVSIDNAAAAYTVVKHLISIGHKQIAMINTDEKFLYARLRKEGYLKALEEYRLSVNEEWIVNTSLDFESGKRVMRALLASDSHPTAVFAVSDILAIGALKAIKEKGLKVPRDIAVTGFDNINFANMMEPTLTTVAQPMYEMGCEAARMLIDKINHPDEKIHSGIVMDHELIVRESTMK